MSCWGSDYLRLLRQVGSSDISVIWLTGHQVIQQSSDLVERDHSRSAAVQLSWPLPSLPCMFFFVTIQRLVCFRKEPLVDSVTIPPTGCSNQETHRGNNKSQRYGRLFSPRYWNSRGSWFFPPQNIWDIPISGWWVGFMLFLFDLLRV